MISTKRFIFSRGNCRILLALLAGGVFIGGGIAAAVADSLDGWGLRDAFEDKGRMRRIVAPIPLYVIENPHAGLLGAAASLQSLASAPS